MAQDERPTTAPTQALRVAPEPDPPSVRAHASICRRTAQAAIFLMGFWQITQGSFVVRFWQTFWGGGGVDLSLCKGLFVKMWVLLQFGSQNGKVHKVPFCRPFHSG